MPYQEYSDYNRDYNRAGLISNLAQEARLLGLRNVFGELVPFSRPKERGLSYNLPKLGSPERPHRHRAVFKKFS